MEETRSCRRRTRDPDKDTMKLRSLFIAAFSLVLCMHGANAEVTPPPDPPKAVPMNLLIVGDSAACAIGSIARSVTKNMDSVASVDVQCKVGSRIEEWSGRRFEYALLMHPKADTVLVFLGGNNVGQKQAPDVSKILASVEAHDLRCTWAGPAAVHGRRWKLNEQLKASITHGCGYFESENVDMKLVDGLHPDKEGAKKWLLLVLATVPQRYK